MAYLSLTLLFIEHFYYLRMCILKLSVCVYLLDYWCNEPLVVLLCYTNRSNGVMYTPAITMFEYF